MSRPGVRAHARAAGRDPGDRRGQILRRHGKVARQLRRGRGRQPHAGHVLAHRVPSHRVQQPTHARRVPKSRQPNLAGAQARALQPPTRGLGRTNPVHAHARRAAGLDARHHPDVRIVRQRERHEAGVHRGRPRQARGDGPGGSHRRGAGVVHGESLPGRQAVQDHVLPRRLPRPHARLLVHHAQQAHTQAGRPRVRLAHRALSQTRVPAGGQRRGERSRGGEFIILILVRAIRLTSCFVYRSDASPPRAS